MFVGMAQLTKKQAQGLKKKVKRAAKKAAKNEIKRDFRKSNRKKRTNYQKKFKGRSGMNNAMERRIENTIRRTEGYRTPLPKYRVKDVQDGSAPYHPIYGNGKRFHFSYLCRDIGRTGDTNTFSATYDGVSGSVNAIPVQQNKQNYLFRTRIDDTVTYRYDNGLLSWTSGRLVTSSGTAPDLISNIFYTTESKSVPVENKVTSTMRYFDRYYIRKLDFKYSPTVPKTTAGNLVFGMLRQSFQQFTNSNYENTYAGIASLPNHVETPVCEGCVIHAVKPWKMNQPMIGTPMAVEVGATEIDVEDQLLLAATDTTLGSGLSDKLGTLWVDMIVDCYSETWTPNDMLSGTIAMQKSVSAPVVQSQSSSTCTVLNSTSVTSANVDGLIASTDKDSKEWKEFVDFKEKQKIRQQARDSYVLVKPKQEVKESKEEKKAPNGL